MILYLHITSSEAVKVWEVFSALSSGWTLGQSYKQSLGGGPLLLVRRLVDLHGRAGAHEILVTVDVVNPGDGGPEFGLGPDERLRGNKKQTLFNCCVRVRQLFSE